MTGFVQAVQAVAECTIAPTGLSPPSLSTLHLDALGTLQDHWCEMSNKKILIIYKLYNYL